MNATSAIVMPKLGLTMTEGVVASWRVGPGDQVRGGDVLFVVETEKIATEVEAQGDGRIESIEVLEGATVPVGTVVATWTGKGVVQLGEDDRSAPVPAADRPAPQGARPLAASGGRIIATPLARRLARKAGIPLATVTGTGPRGRIKARDVETAMAAQSAAVRSIAPPSEPVAAGDRRDASALEKTVARRMTEAKQAIPHFYVLAEADVTGLLKLRDELNAMEGFARISINHLVLAAVGRALLRMPDVNVVWADDAFVQLTGSDVGMAVDTGRGLFAPVIRDAGILPLDALAGAANAIAERAKAGELLAGDLAGGAIAVSNVGMYGASHLVPIINPGQSAILGVAGIKQVFRPDANEQPVLRREIGLVLSCDHRVLNGVAAARFLDCITGILQNPLNLLRI
ncbi:dihydrolipoamide acetyltransferase family protein [uncultured Bradyrhizobium sp.]|uniref:dihydrolipoamide acetyltransferase family protein n=1 Tax=Bradyrhizobium sp. TaxID=376 RepID=UPI00261D21D7|nr:dihydrolipoamide acetyltransferase family protein [uncultured Bradyrhizobium sp.]